LRAEPGTVSSAHRKSKDAGLPDKHRRDPHKPGESPALQQTVVAAAKEFQQAEVSEDLQLLADFVADVSAFFGVRRLDAAFPSGRAAPYTSR